MKKTWKIAGLAVLVFAGACILLNVVLSLMGGHFSITLPVEHKSEFTHVKITQFPGQLHSRGNQIVNAAGKVVLLRGLMPPDPARLRSDGDFDRAFFTEMAGTGANVIRIPVHPENWVRDPDYLWRYLDPIVAWAGEENLYVILDWHYIGNFATGAGLQMPDLDVNPRDLTLEFWRSTARYFRNAPHVIFEVFNEPQSIGAKEWHDSATEIVQAIRDLEADQLVIVGGIDYGKDLSWVLEHPIEEENLAYASHIYPEHASSSWPYWFGDVAEQYPVVITEWGFMDDNGDPSQSYLAGDKATYGEPFIGYLSDRNLGWVACWYDDEWLPPIFSEGRKGYTPYGEFVIQQLKETE